MNRAANPWRSVFRVGLVLYTLALLTGTHWPGLTPPGQEVFRTDLVIHFGMMCVLTWLLFAAGLVGARRAIGARLVLTFLVVLGFAGFDELTQPLFGRTADWVDFGVDAAGALMGCGMIWAWWRVWGQSWKSQTGA